MVTVTSQAPKMPVKLMTSFFLLLIAMTLSHQVLAHEDMSDFQLEAVLLQDNFQEWSQQEMVSSTNQTPTEWFITLKRHWIITPEILGQGWFLQRLRLECWAECVFILAFL